MTREDFLEVVSTWNALYSSNHHAYEICNKPYEIDWKKGLLKVASVFSVIDDIKGTSVELMMNRVIIDARSNDTARLQDIHEILHTVENFMNEEGNF
ncbi:MAG: hypothetical protein LLG37_07465 [Spirochaetia bacterium]|nr:hypothetical protein [Spirochaetia bacterium]